MSELQVAAAQQLADFVDLEFARRLEMAETVLPDCVEALRRYNPASPSEAETVAGGVAFFGGKNYPSNQIVGMGLYGAVTADDLDRVEHFFRSRDVPSTIVVSPLSDMSLPALLGERGYRIAEFNSVLIKRISPNEPFEPPAGIVIERVTPQTARPWMHSIAKRLLPGDHGRRRSLRRLCRSAGSAGVPGADRRRGRGWLRRPHHSRGANRGPVRHGHASGISPARRAERADCPSAARSLQGGVRVRGGQHQSGQRFAA